MNMIADITSFNWESVLPVERTRLVRLSARLSGDYEAAEDLAQETLLEAWRVRHRLTDPRGYAPWLSAIARNVCLRWARRRGQQPAQLSLRDEADEIPALNAQMPPGAAYDVELELERDELATLLDRALALLPAETRTVLVERYVEETPLAEVAAWLRISEGTLAVRLHRGKLALRRVLTTDLHDEAVAYGLAGTDDAAWQETRIWCSHCRRRRLRAWFDRARGELAFGCPDCCPEPISYHYAKLPEVFAGVKGYRPALSRQQAWADAYFWQGLAQRSAPCIECGRSATVRLGMPEHIAAWLTGVHVVHVRCDHCHRSTWDWTTLTGLALSLPEGRRFWQRHQRIQTLPERPVEVDGRPAILTSFRSVTGTAQLDVVALRDTFEVIHVHGAPPRGHSRAD